MDLMCYQDLATQNTLEAQKPSLLRWLGWNEFQLTTSPIPMAEMPLVWRKISPRLKNVCSVAL
jgi:hypothetical protein